MGEWAPFPLALLGVFVIVRVVGFFRSIVGGSV